MRRAPLSSDSIRHLPQVFLALLLFTQPLAAQSVPTGFQEYFVLGFEQHVWNMLTRVQTLEGGPAFANGMNSVVSATASADNQVIIYDHWEDGLEANPQAPVQASTLIIGDANNANGRACDFTTDPRVAPCNGTNDDLLFAGTFVNFNSDQGLGCAAPPNDLNCSVPVNPRNPADIRYDGGDFLVSSGGPLSLVHPQDPLSPFIGGATEIISRQALANATAYSIPIGEDIYLGDNSVTEPFKYVDLNLVAFDDNTQVNVDSPGAGNVSFTLNRGEHWTSRGLIGTVAAPTIIVNAGTRISTTGPLAGLIFTGADGTFATRFYSLLPDILHSSDYVITAPGDDPTPQGSRPLNLYVFNPDPLNALVVTATDSAGTVNINVPAGASVDYFTTTGRFVPANSTVRMTSNRNFWGVSAYSYNSPANDWGHSWLSRKFVTANYTVPFAPGVNNPAFQSQQAQRIAQDPNCAVPVAGPGVCDTINRVPVFVSAMVNNTEIQIDFDNDGAFDVIDLDGDDFPDPAPLPNNTYRIDALASLRVYDHNDYDNTGTKIVANKPVAVAYGQDTDQATGPDPVQDTGYAVYPINQIFLDPALVIEKTVNSTVLPIGGGVATYTLTVRTFDFGPFTSLQVYDLLPPGIIGADYVPGSTLVTYPDLSQSTADPAASIDPGTGRDRLDWTLSPDTLQANQTLTIRYSIAVPAAPGGTPRQLTNEAHAEAVLGSSTFSPLDTADVIQSDVNLTKAVDDQQPEAGDILTFTLNVFNNGLTPETNVEVIDPIPADTTFVPASITSGLFTGTFDSAQNAVVWTLANFAAGASDTLTFQVQVNPGVPSGTLINNQASYESTETPLFLSNEVEPVVVGPNLVVAKTGSTILHPNETTTYTITVDNIGDGTANNVRIVDPFPANVTYVADSMEWRKNVGPFASVTDAADLDEGEAFVDRLELSIANLGPGEDLTFRFQVQVNPGTGGLFANNQATVSADEVIPTATNLVQSPIVGNADVTGHVFLDVDGDGTQDPGEPDLVGVDVVVTDSTGAQQTVTTDANGDWLATVTFACYEDSFVNVAYDGSVGSLDWSGAGDEWTEFGVSADQDPATLQLAVEADPLGVFGNSLLIEGEPVAGNRGFTRQADLSAGAGFTQGFATLSFDHRRVSMESADSVQLDVDYDNDGTFNDILATFPGNDATPTDATWQSSTIVLDAGQLPDDPVVFRFLGTNFNFNNDNFYVDNVRLCNTQVTADVDESDPDMPDGVTLSTANDPQSIAAVEGGSVATGDVGYEPPALTFTKTSDAPANGIMPGDRLTYTLQVNNPSTVTQTGIQISDTVPTGTSYVAASTQINQNAFRVNEYYIAPGAFTGTTFNLNLVDDLLSDYFVIIQGSDGGGGAGTTTPPSRNYVGLTGDPFATGDLTNSGSTDVLVLSRGGSAAMFSWSGVVTVIESISDPATSGFRLRSVERVIHAGAGLSGVDTSATAWSSLNQVMLMGGFNGAGCTTLETQAEDHKVCHARLFPSGTDTINWTRDGGGAISSLTAATSTVMVVEWGSEWTVQRVRITGTNGGNGANAAGEYNTAAISSVARENTWVWGTGHTTQEGIGEAAEAVLITLGDGVDDSSSPQTTVAAGKEYAGSISLDFEVYALTHPDLAVDYRFVQDGAPMSTADPTNGIGDEADPIEDVPVDSALSGKRMALVYNGQNGQGTAYPRPMFSARFLADDTVRLERRRIGQPFPAWIQGIDFSGIQTTPVAGGALPNPIVPADGYILPPNCSLTVTFQVDVDDPLAVTEITNTATLNTDQEGPINASVTDPTLRLGVTVEPNNAGFAVPGGSVTYTHVVTNTGQDPDSYDLTLVSELGYTVELIDPDSGAVIATDTNGDGVWDGGVMINTGTLNAGETAEYRVRVNVPLGATIGTEESTTLNAVSDRDGSISAFATDETTVVDSLDVGPVALDPDHSGVVAAGGSIAYTHTVTNNTGATDTFDLTAFPTLPGWTATIYNDSNGDGTYTPGVDVAITNTLQLADGQLQTIFVVVDAPPGAMPGDTDVVHLTAISQNDPALFDAATDTTTIIPATTHDLSGGGTLLVDQGDTAVFPGTLKNLQDSSDRFDLTITASLFFGLDGLNHPTQLVIDTNADGVPDTQIAEDADGDGTWDTVNPAYDTDMDGNPDFAVAANSELAYELRRPVDPAQPSYRDPITLTATSQATGEVDSVTTTNLLAAVTHALLTRFDVYFDGARTVVEWHTASEAGTVGFYLERRPGHDARLRHDAYGNVRRLTRSLLPGLLHAPQGGTYHFVDETALVGERYTYQLVEVDVRGDEERLGPFEVTVEHRGGAISPPELAATSYVSEARRSTSPPRRSRAAVSEKMAAPPSGWLRLPVETTGLSFVAASDLAGAFGESESVLKARLASGGLRIFLDRELEEVSTTCPSGPFGTDELFRDPFETGNVCAWTSNRGPITRGTEIAWTPADDASGLYFYGEAIESIYTQKNVYWITRGPGGVMATRDGSAPAAVAPGSFTESVHLEEELYPLTSVIDDPESDFWFWEFFLAGNPTLGVRSFTAPTPGAMPGAAATLTVHLQGETDTADVTPDHHVAVRWNGTLIGESFWNGPAPHSEAFTVPAGIVQDGDNIVELTSVLEPGVAFDVLYLEAFDVTYTRLHRASADRLEAEAGAGTVTFEGFTQSDVALFDVTNPRRPVSITGASVDLDNGTYRVSFSSPSAGRYLALRLSEAAGVVPEVDFASDLTARRNEAEYVILAGPGLESASETLAEHRRGQGLATLTVRLQDVYDEFNSGVASPWAIRDFLARAATWRQPPRWLVLAGDGSFDYKGLQGTGDSLLPTLLAPTPDGLFPSDNRLADLTGDDGVPEVAVGRLPARTNAELADYVAKLIAYEASSGGRAGGAPQQSWRNRTHWVADNVDKGGEFTDDMETLIPLVSPGLSTQRIYVDELGVDTSRSELLSALEAGGLLINYLGHGGPDRLASEGLLTTADIAGLGNGERLPVLTALTCSVGRFDFPGFDTLSESLVRHAGGGVVALWSPAGLSFNHDARQLGDAFLRSTFTSGTTLGEAARAALAEYHSDLESAEWLPFVFTLLGDPAIRLRP